MLKLRLLIAAMPILLLVESCYAPYTSPLPRTPDGYTHAYVAPGVTDLRDSPGYEGNVVGQVYQGEQVTLLPEARPGWRRVRSQRRGLVGWIQTESLTLQPVPIKNFYVSSETLRLRKCPQEACSSLRLLYRGDQVQKVGENQQGWWRVLEAKGHTLGWVPAGTMSDRLTQVQVKKQSSRIKRISRKAKTSPQSPPKEQTNPEPGTEESGSNSPEEPKEASDGPPVM